MVSLWFLYGIYYLPREEANRIFLLRSICPEQKLTMMTRELFYEHEKHRMNGNFFVKLNKLHKSVSFVISVFKKRKRETNLSDLSEKINAKLICYSWKLMLSRKAKCIMSH